MNRFGLEENQWEILQKIALNALLKNGCKLWVFGSRATGKHKKFSDIDILIENGDKISEFLLTSIRSELEESNLPIKVDLVLEEDLAESYRKNVDTQKVQIY